MKSVALHLLQRTFTEFVQPPGVVIALYTVIPSKHEVRRVQSQGDGWVLDCGGYLNRTNDECASPSTKTTTTKTVEMTAMMIAARSEATSITPLCSADCALLYSNDGRRL